MKLNKKSLLKILGIIFLVLGFGFVPMLVKTASIDELQEELNQKQEEIRSLEERIRAYKEKIEAYKQEAATLKGQIDILDTGIQETQAQIEVTKAKIEEVNLEIEKVEKEIEQKEREIKHQKEILAELIRVLYEYDFKSPIEILLSNPTFSEFLDQIQFLELMQNRGQETLEMIQRLKAELENQQAKLEEFKQELTKLKSEQETQKRVLSDQKESKEQILTQTLQQEEVYQTLLEAARKEQKRADSAIRALESQIRKILEKEGKKALPAVGTLDWPIEPGKGISAYFHDPSYEAQFGLVHNAIDIPCPQGTPIKAPAVGYVAKNHNAGMGYSYIVLIHGSNVSTVYGHVSGFAAQEGTYVSRGQVIGNSGGMPGSPGAGWLTTGPHLHFEVRIDGNPVNPMNYLK